MSGERFVESVQARFWAKVNRSGGPHACWEWMGSGSRGYGGFWVGGGVKKLRAHRVAYELLVGPIPDGLTIDHLCRNKGCVNPLHLEPVTERENIRRGTSGSGLNAQKTRCIRDHPLFGENLRIRSDGRRRCKTCERATQRGRWARRAAKRQPPKGSE